MTHALHLTTWHPYVDGVSGVFVLEQCAALHAMGGHVGLIFSRIKGLRGITYQSLRRGMPGFVRLNVPVPTFGFKSCNMPGMNRFVPCVNDLMLHNRYKAYERAYGRPDILHAHVGLGAGVAARRIAARIGRDYVVTEHSSEILNGCLAPDRKAAVRMVYAEARSVLAVSAVLAERITDICPFANVTVVGNMVRDSVFRLRHPEPKLGDRFTVVSISSLVPDKRIYQALVALAGLPPELKERVDYHVIGDGPERNRLRELARVGSIKTSFHGNVPHKKAMEMLSGADVLVHPSAFETFGVVLAEAMALGVPVVATRCGGPEDIVTNETGVLVPVDDIDALMSAIEDVLSHLDSWKARGNEIAEYAFARFHETAVCQAIMKAY